MITDTIATNYGYITIPRNDLYIRDSLLYSKVWEKHLCDFFESNLNEGDVALDIGAFVGTHTLVMAGAVGESGKVHAFEPGPFYNLIEINAVQNNKKNIIVHHKGLSDEESVMYIPTMKEETFSEHKNWGAVHLRSDKTSEIGTDMDEVNVVTLDSLDINGRVKLLKIDTEGMELKVLKGGKNLIRKYKPILVVEINHDPGSEEYKNIVTYLDENLGYTLLINFMSNETMYRTCDYLCVPKVH